MKVCVLGAGAIGCHIAGHLAQAKLCEVSVLARGNTLKAIRERGIRVVTPSVDFTVDVQGAEDSTALGIQDYVFVTLKAHQVDQALPQLRALVGPRTVLIPPTTAIPYYFFHGFPGQLGGRRLPEIDPKNLQWLAMPPEQVIAAVIWIGAHVVQPGWVEQDGTAAGLPIGELSGQPSERTQVLSDLLNRSGIRAPVRDNIRGEIWIKFVNSLCWNPVALLTLARMGQIGSSAEAVAVVTAMMHEMDAIGTSFGLRLPQPPERRIAVTLGAVQHKMSMLQDLEHGRPLELEPLRQSLDAIKALSGGETPTVDCVLALAELRAQRARVD